MHFDMSMCCEVSPHSCSLMSHQRYNIHSKVPALAKKPHNSSVPFKRNHADSHHKALGMVMLTKIMYLCAFIYVYMCLCACLYTDRHTGICV